MSKSLLTGIVLGLCIPLSLTWATDYNWKGNADANWATAANWTPSTGVPGGTDNALFSTNTVVGNKTPWLDQDRSIKNISFKSTGWLLSGAPSTMIVGAGGVKSDSNLGTNVIAFNVTATSIQPWNIGSNSVVEFTGSLNFTSVTAIAAEKNGLGTMRISGTTGNVPDPGTATYGWHVTAGTLELNRTGTNALTGKNHGVSGTATIRLLQSDQFKTTHNVWIAENGTLDLNSNNQTLASIRLAARMITNASNTSPTNGAGRVQMGTGTLTLTQGGSPALVYTGNTTVSNTTGTVAGRLFLSGTNVKVISADNGIAPIDLSISAVIGAVTNAGLRFDNYVAGGGSTVGGTIELTGVNTFSNSVVVSNVTVLVSNGGSIGLTNVSTDVVSVLTNGTLGGSNGCCYGDVTVYGTLAPGSVDAGGSTVGTLTAGATGQHAGVTFTNGSVFAVNVSGASADLLNVVGPVRFGAAPGTTNVLSVTALTTPTLSEYLVLQATDGISVSGALAFTGTGRLTKWEIRSGTQLWVRAEQLGSVITIR